MREIDLNTWNRKQHYDHFCSLTDPSFAVTIPFDVTQAYKKAKDSNISFFAKYLHDCMLAINTTENLKYRIENNKVIAYDVIHASPTIMKADNTYGFSMVDFDTDLNIFIKNLEAEKHRVQNSTNLYPPREGILNCIYCSAMPWLNFTGHKEPFSGTVDSVPKLAFGKASRVNNILMMNVSLNVNHALVDGYHVSLFAKKFQDYLNA